MTHDEVIVEPIGGFVGAGGPGHVKSEGRMAMSELSADDRAKVDAWFTHPPLASPTNFYYRVTRHGADGTKTVNVPGNAMPAVLVASIRSELR